MRLFRSFALISALAVPLTACASQVRSAPVDPEAPRTLVEQAVAYTHDGVELEGFLAFDPGIEGQRPGVLIVHEWWGLGEHPKKSAQRLARMGYVAFACDMYGKGRLTDDPQQAGAWSGQFRGENRELGRARVRAGYDAMVAHPLVDPLRTAAMGYCFGGTISLELAWSGAPLRGVVSFHGHPTAPEPEDFPGITADVMVCHGAADGFVPDEMIAAFEDAMRRSATPWTFVNYGGAVHSFTNPAADGHGIPGVKYDERADLQSWDHMAAFFERLLRLPQ